MMKRLLLLSALAAACSRAAVSPPPPVPAERRAPDRPVVEVRTPGEDALFRVVRIEVQPRSIEVEVDGRAALRATAYDADGRAVTNAPLRIFGANGIARVLRDGTVLGLRPGRGTLVVQAPAPTGTRLRPVEVQVPVTVHDLPVAKIRIESPIRSVYAGTTARFAATPINTFGNPRANTRVTWRSSAPDILDISPGGTARARRPGRATLTAAAGGVEERIAVEVKPNPVRSLTLEPAEADVRTGDVVRLTATARDAHGRAVPDAVPVFSIAMDARAERAGALVYPDGAFVAEDPGAYTVVATFGDLVAEATIVARPRALRTQTIVLDHVGHPWTAMTDLWVFEGADGRDYAYTGTKQPGGRMYVWDVTDPSDIVLTDSVLVDARTVNDVKVSSDARFAVITREGASDRRNGIVFLDLADPAHPRIASSFTEGLTGGVHNTWIEGRYVYAINDGTRDMHIVDASDIHAPRAAGRWGLPKENKSLHDVQIGDGYAYLSYWDDGLFILDVGAGTHGGSPTQPKLVSSVKYPAGNTHAAYPYTNESGRRYVFVTDEIFDAPFVVPGTPRGYLHVFDITDLENPVEVAKYEVPEAGTHNMWIEDDVLYLAYYNGGLRVVDVSGELRGDLYRQGREIAHVVTAATEEEGAWFANQSRAWGPQLHKGVIFVSDKYSGLWAVKLAEPRRTDDSTE